MPIRVKPSLLAVAALALAAGAAAVALSKGAWLGPSLATAGVLLVIAWYFSQKNTMPVETGEVRGSKVQDIWLLPTTDDVFELIPDPLMLLDSAGRVMVANRAMRTALGAEAAGKHVSSVLRTPSVLQAIERTTQTGETQSVEFAFNVPLLRNYQAHIARTERPPQMTVLLLHDLTAIRRAEQARTDFIANVSHELRTPLAAVSGFIDTLKGHARDDAEAREKFLGIMSVEAERMRRLIDDLLSLTRIEQNEHVPPSGQTDVVNVVKNAVAALSPLARADNIQVSIEDPGGLPDVPGAGDELSQLFQNLIHNAIKYGKPGGQVRIAATAVEAPAAPGRRAGQAMVAVSISDDGEGIPREAIPRLTERFYRVDVKRSREKGGTGLGLAIVKHIVNRHQGRLTIESQSGEGSTFTVYLPVAASSSTPAVTELIQ